ncbi:MAG: hypothetical protein ACE5JD_16845 [Candidatus Methylomirabilia bacterium]
MIERLPELVNGDAALVRRGRYFTADFLVAVGSDEYLVCVVEGRIQAVERGPFLMRSWTFAIRAPAEAWARFWEPLPAPGYHDLFAMTKSGVARIEGELHPLMANLRFVKELLEAPRWMVARAARAGSTAHA